MSLTACATDTPNENQGEKIDPYAEPVIVIDEESVERKERYDSEGKHVGYYQFISGTNCEVAGIIRIEYLDLEGNVLKSYSPQFAGCTMDYSVREEHVKWNEITVIVEANYNWETHVDYEIAPFTNGNPELVTYTVNKTTNQIDVYGADAEVATSIKTLDEKNSLDIFTWAGDCMSVWEYYTDENYRSYQVREVLFDSNRNLLCEVLLTSELPEGKNNVITTRLEIKDSQGQSKRVYEQSVEGATFSIGGNDDGTQLDIYEELETGKRIWHEVYDPRKDEVIFKEKLIYDTNGNYVHRELEVFGGKVVTTESQYPGYYVKAEFYDAQGDLRKMVDTTDTGEYFIVKWDKNNRDCVIEYYTEKGPTGDIDFYEPY